MSITLILGGARSGKSRRAEALARAHAGPVSVVATAQRFDGDDAWDARIEAHRARRPADWRTDEVPLELPAHLSRTAAPGVVLVDCLTVWLSNWILAERREEDAESALVDAIGEASADLLLVSNEVGSGVHPPTEIGRRFQDAQGRLNQAVAAAADRVEWVVAGIPVPIKAPE